VQKVDVPQPEGQQPEGQPGPQEKKTQLPPTAPDAAPGPPEGDVGSGVPLRVYANPAALPEQIVFRPKTGQEYASLQDAIRDAAAGETIWIGPGVWTEAIAPIAKALVLKGAGRDQSRIDLTGHAGLTLTGATGGIEDLDICCATGDAVLRIGGAFQGRVAHVRLRQGAGWGLLVHGSAAVDSVDLLFEGNGKGTVSVRRPATLSMQ
jgi:hypothetical protein